MINLKKWITACLEVICVIMFIFITVVGTYQIITRYVFNAPSTVSEELLTYSFTWLALLAAALVFGKREHMRMSFLADKLSGNSLKAIYIASECLVIIFAIFVMIYGGFSITKLTSTQITASLGIPMSYVYFIVPVCGIFTALFGVINIYEIIVDDDICPLSKSNEVETRSEKVVYNTQTDMKEPRRGGK